MSHSFLRLHRVFGLVALLLLCASGTASAQGYEVVRTVFLPTVFYVGDRVEARVIFRTTGGAVPSLPADYVGPTWGEIHDMRLQRIGPNYELRFLFSAFVTGTQLLPPIDMGEFVLSDIDVHIDSLLSDESADISPPSGQILVPGTRFLVAAILVVLFVVPIVSIVSFRTVRRWIERAIARRRAKRPYRRVTRALKGLSVQASTLDGKGFYIVLLDEVRRYLSDRTGTDWMAATASEVDRRLGGVVADLRHRDTLSELFTYGDLVKFGGKPSPLAKRLAHVDGAEDAVGSIEEGLGEKRVGV